tara:strand:- start:3835 stop:3987 length:153 start_codon:yes stop_codon:yes gene_type:complete
VIEVLNGLQKQHEAPSDIAINHADGKNEIHAQHLIPAFKKAWKAQNGFLL